MYTHLDCIALRCVRLTDSKNLLSAWTRTHGRVTFAIPAGASKEARRRRAITGPMMLFSGVSDIRPGHDVLFIRDIQSHASVSMPSPEKTMIAIFLSEVLDRLLRRGEVDPALSEFLFSSATALAGLTAHGDIANFHIIFLFRLTRFLGIEPCLDGDGTVFDLRQAGFRPTPPLHHDFIEGRAARLVRILPRFDYQNGHMLPLDNQSRREALSRILDFYGIHLESLASIKSLEILRSMMI